MPDLKISQLPAASTPLAGTELVPIVQGGTTDQTTVQAILTSAVPSGTANGVLFLNGSKVVTSGSALTFDGASLRLANAVGTTANGLRLDGGAQAHYWYLSDNVTSAYEIGSGAGQWKWLNSSGEQMRLTSTGLGIGTSSPGAKLGVGGNAIFSGGVGGSPFIAFSQDQAGGTPAYWQWASTTGLTTFYTTDASSANGSFRWMTAGAERMRLDSSGNLGLGVTPSAWSLLKGFDISSGGALFGYTAQVGLANNAFFNGTDWRYKNTDAAAFFRANALGFEWHTAPSGTAGNAISFSQVMTLDASGRLGVGTTSPSNIGVTAESTGSSSVYFTANNTTGYNFIAGVATAAGYGLLGMTTNHALAFLTNNSERARIPAAGGMVVGTAALATTATDGFLYVPTCAGTPTGTPTTQTGTAPIVVDTTNNKLYFYSGGQWRDAGP